MSPTPCAFSNGANCRRKVFSCCAKPGSWDHHNDIAVGQFYQVSADMRRPYYVCGGLQDNNAWCGPSALRSNTGGVNTDWYTIAGGDGFYTRQDPTDWAIAYGESQDGNMSRHDLRNGTQKSIRPNAGRGVTATGPNDTRPPAAPLPDTANAGTTGAGTTPSPGAPDAAAAAGFRNELPPAGRRRIAFGYVCRQHL